MMNIVRLLGLGKAFCIPLQMLAPRKTAYFPVWKTEKLQTSSSLRTKQNLRWKRLSKLKCTRTICQFFTSISECEFIQCWQLERTAILSSSRLMCLLLHNTREEEKACWEFRGGSRNWRAVFSDVTDNFRCLHNGLFFHK